MVPSCQVLVRGKVGGGITVYSVCVCDLTRLGLWSLFLHGVINTHQGALIDSLGDANAANSAERWEETCLYHLQSAHDIQKNAKNLLANFSVKRVATGFVSEAGMRRQ